MTDPRPAYQVMPPLSPAEYEALKADISAHGIQVPVVVDQDGVVIDGHNRMAIAKELGVEAPLKVKTYGSEAERHDHALALNLARRHLNSAQKREIIASEINRDADRSDRELARLIGCDHKTVGSVRRELRGEIPHAEPMSAMEARRVTDEARAALDKLRSTLREAVDKGVRPEVLLREASTAACPPDSPEEVRRFFEAVVREAVVPLSDSEREQLRTSEERIDRGLAQLQDAAQLLGDTKPAGMRPEVWEVIQMTRGRRRPAS